MRLRLKLTNKGGEESVACEVNGAGDVSWIKEAMQKLICAELNNGNSFNISWQLGDPDTITPGADGDYDAVNCSHMVAMVDRWLA